MSSEYLNKTEEQQFEEAKNWFKENSTPILLAIFVFATASFGWNFWKSHQAESAIQASISYQATMEAYEQDPVKNQPLVAKFLEEMKGTNYAIFMQLEEAKNAVAKGDFAVAKSQLQAALNEVKDPSLQSIIRFRLAAVDFQLKEFDSALANLEQIKDQAWDARKQLFIADLLVAKGDKEAAKSAYEQIKAKMSGQERELIELKINNL
ncbi:MAG: tetratricopeptide repeat protein [Haemophilus parahaemolyticus]|uniref:YfgM family protein n=1 Tax=Haemophilus parahaemolyticus TaxID=735 RepID=UPI0026F06D80|nr:tetratricopeptide repeat protein [Haemophilus parahaemolyticus]MBS6009674.1 tetratricopeptide repeat protein [Haemophilus parahaemolyticus]